MKKLVCDLCQRTEKYCSYTIRRKWSLRVFEWDSQGGMNRTLDVCDECFNRIAGEARKVEP